MLETLRSVASLLLSYGLLLLANGLFGTLLGVRTQIEGFPTEVVGVVMAGYFLGLLAGAVLAVRVVAAVGHIRAFAAFASIMSVSALTHVLWIQPAAWFVMRIASGFCMAGMIMVTESWLNERATNRTRGQVLSLYMITGYASAGAGQFLLPLADPARFELFSVASIIFSLALVPVLLTSATAPLPARRRPLDFRELFRVSPFGVLGVLCAGLVNASFYGLGPVFARGVGLSVAGTSAFMASVIFGGLVLQWPMGRLSDRIDRRRVLIGVTFATSAACVGIVLASAHPGPWLLVAGAVYGSLAFTIYSLSAAHTNDFSRPEERVQTASGLLVAYGVGACVGPIAAAGVMGRVGPQGMFLYSAVITALLAAFGLYRMRRRAAPAPQEQQPLIPAAGSQIPSEGLYMEMRKQMDRDLAHLSGRRRR